MKIPAPRIQCAEQFGEVDDSASLEVDDFALAADLAVDAEQAGADDFAALAFHELGADDDVGEAGFVLEGDEHRAFGGAGALAAGDDAGGADELAVGAVGDLPGGDEAHGGEAFAQQGEWVAAEGETEAGVVVADVAGFAGIGELGGGLMHRGVLQHAFGQATGGGLPECLASVASEALQGAGGSEAFELAGVKPGAGGEFVDRGKTVLLAGGDDAFGGLLREALDHAQAESGGGGSGVKPIPFPTFSLKGEGLGLFAGFEGAGPVAGADVGGADFDAVAAGVLDEL